MISKYKKNAKEEELFKSVNQAIKNIRSDTTNNDNINLPIIYIVGAPRSGTTILSQVLSYSLDVGYINNLIARFWEKPSVGITLSNRLLDKNGRDFISFTSRHGTTTTIGDPHEYGNFWTKIFNLNNCQTHHLSSEELKKLNHDENRVLIEDEVVGSFNKPVLFKNIICGFHAEYLTKLHPSSLFLFIERNSVDTISSIIKVRKERLGDEKQWWSLKPLSYHKVLSNDYIEEVTKQVVYSKKEFIGELTKPNINFSYIRYEDFIQDPNRFIRNIADSLYELFGYKLEYREINTDFIKLNKANLEDKNSIISDKILEINGAVDYEYKYY